MFASSSAALSSAASSQEVDTLTADECMRRIKCLRTTYDYFYQEPLPGRMPLIPGSCPPRPQPMVMSGKFKGITWDEARAKIAPVIKELAARVEKTGTPKQKAAAQSHELHVIVGNASNPFCARKTKRDAGKVKREAERAEVEKAEEIRLPKMRLTEKTEAAKLLKHPSNPKPVSDDESSSSDGSSNSDSSSSESDSE
jgi:hypothetical protein